MAKQSGLGWTTCTVGGNAIINDVTALDVSTPRAMQEVTGLDKSAVERIGLLADLSLSLKGVFNASASQSHVTLRDVASSAAKAVTLTIAAKSLTPNVFFTDYKLSRKESGEFTWDAPAVLSDGAVPAWS